MSTSTYVQEYNAIVDVLSQYNEGGAKADSALMKPAFNQQATMFGGRRRQARRRCDPEPVRRHR